jgi:hypothetical protein
MASWDYEAYSDPPRDGAPTAAVVVAEADAPDADEGREETE